MRRILLAAAALIVCTTVCNPQDTKRIETWQRVSLARISGAAWQPCDGCKPAPPRTDRYCDAEVRSAADAALALATRPECLDIILGRLAPFAGQNELAVAYFVRAQRDDTQSDLLRALDAAMRAARSEPPEPAALFNRALMQETVGLYTEALDSWHEALRHERDAGWRAEIERHIEALPHQRTADAKWKALQPPLEEAIAAGDEQTIERLIADFPKSALGLWPHVDPKGAFRRALTKRIGGEPFNPTQIKGSDLATLDQRARRSTGYELAVVDGTRCFQLFLQSQYVDSIDACRDAIGLYIAHHDRESLAGLYGLNAGSYWTVGQNELAWRNALDALANVPYTTNPVHAHSTYGELRDAALAFDYREIALAFQNETFKFTTSDEEWAVALRHMAELELGLGRIGDAQKDLRQAVEKSSKPDGSKKSRRIALNMLVTRGQLVIRSDPRQAIRFFNEAYDQTPADELRTFRAWVLSQRAEAYRFLRDDARRRQDLQAALQELETEQRTQLENRKRGDGEDIWLRYFARFDDIYENLIRDCIDRGDKTGAWNYVERRSAYEPLDLIKKLPFLPPHFRELVQDGLTPEEFREELPAGTYVLRYSVLSDRTYVWVISHDEVQFIPLDVPRSTIERWFDTIQAARRNEKELEIALRAPAERLLAPALRTLRDPLRLVIIPDGPMRGFPFAAMRQPNLDQYVFELAPIEMASSATLYLFSMLRDAGMLPASQKVVLFGNPANDFPPRLPGAESEVETIRALYGEAEVRIGVQATVDEFVRLAPGSALIHFAGHAIANPLYPERSTLLFAKSGGGSGTIEAQDLLRRLSSLRQTRLIVLAACGSAAGQPVGPEGISPLVRPFVAAGVPAVVGSLWDLNDATAEEVFVSFHRHYSEGKDAAAALQAVQRELLRNEKAGLGSVLTWGPLQVIGHGSSPYGFPAKNEMTEERLEPLHRKDSLHRDARIRPQ